MDTIMVFRITLIMVGIVIFMANIIDLECINLFEPHISLWAPLLY